VEEVVIQNGNEVTLKIFCIFNYITRGLHTVKASANCSRMCTQQRSGPRLSEITGNLARVFFKVQICLCRNYTILCVLSHFDHERKNGKIWADQNTFV